MQISVVVPVYGAEKYLNKCVDSLISQDFTGSMEIILVDDGSKDMGGEICDEYARKYDNISVIHKENGGLMSAWIEGSLTSKGDYLVFVDSDDFVEKEMLSMLYARRSDDYKDAEIICCNNSIDHANGKLEYAKHAIEPGEYIKQSLDEDFKKNILGFENRKVSFSRCMKLISRKLILDNIKYCDKRIKMGEDVNIMLPALLDCKRLFVLDEAFYYHYFYNDESMVHAYNKDMPEQMKYLLSAMQTVLDDKKETISNQNKKYTDSILEGFDREKIFLFMLLIKNEMRGPFKGTFTRISELMDEFEIKNILKNNNLEIKDKGNKLLYFMMRHMGPVTLGLVNMIFRAKQRL